MEKYLQALARRKYSGETKGRGDIKVLRNMFCLKLGQNIFFRKRIKWINFQKATT